jgi:hypothetical protein
LEGVTLGADASPWRTALRRLHARRGGESRKEQLERCISRRTVTAVLGLIPIVTGIIAMTGVDDPLYVSRGIPRSPVLDSNLRFFAGVWIGLGIALLWLVPSIERQTTLFRAIWGAVFLGGIGRVGRSCFRSSTRSIYWFYGTRGYRSAVIYLLAATDRTHSRRGRDIVVHEVAAPIQGGPNLLKSASRASRN